MALGNGRQVQFQPAGLDRSPGVAVEAQLPAAADRQGRLNLGVGIDRQAGCASQFAGVGLDQIDRAIAREIAPLGVHHHAPARCPRRLDQPRQDHAALERIDATLRALLRSGAWELIKHPETPREVVIDEYVELAKAFFDDAEARFVNAALDGVAKDTRK